MIFIDATCKKHHNACWTPISFRFLLQFYMKLFHILKTVFFHAFFFFSASSSYINITVIIIIIVLSIVALLTLKISSLMALKFFQYVSPENIECGVCLL